MTVRYLIGDIFNSPTANAITVPVNLQGIMGAGLAKSFADKFPTLVPIYKQLCKERKLDLGHPFAVGLNNVPQDIILFATKTDWRLPSQLDWIEWGLRDMIRKIQVGQWTYKEIALPALGCGLGGLNFYDVKNLMDVIFEDVSTLFTVYRPTK